MNLLPAQTSYKNNVVPLAGEPLAARMREALKPSGSALVRTAADPRQLVEEFEAACRELAARPGAEAEQHLDSIAERADKLNGRQMEMRIGELEAQLRQAQADEATRLTEERDATLESLPEPTKRKARALAQMVDGARSQPGSPYMECAVAKWKEELGRLAPEYAAAQEAIDRLITSDEIAAMRSALALRFKARLTLALSCEGEESRINRFADLSERFKDWELNAYLAKLDPQESAALGKGLHSARMSLFQRYWQVWNAGAQAQAQALESELALVVEQLPLDKQVEAQGLIKDLCAPREKTDTVVALFLLNHISPSLAARARELDDLRAPLRVIERQERALDRLQTQFDLFAPAPAPAEKPACAPFSLFPNA